MHEYIDDINISLENLSLLEKRVQAHDEQKSALVYELALTICTYDDDSQTISDLIKSATETLSISNTISLCIAVQDICNQKSNNIRLKGVYMPVQEEPVRADALNKIAYMKNRYSDEALNIFSSACGINRSFAVNNFTAACDEVVSGNCEFALMPVENSDTGILYSFYSLVENYELKIHTACEITDTNDNFKTTRFALLSRNQASLKLHKNQSQYFEFIYTETDNVTICNILTAAKRCGLRLILHNSVPIAYKTEEYSNHFIFCTDNAKLDAYLLFLSVYTPLYTSLGIYTKLK